MCDTIDIVLSSLNIIIFNLLILIDDLFDLY